MGGYAEGKALQHKREDTFQILSLKLYTWEITERFQIYYVGGTKNEVDVSSKTSLSLKEGQKDDISS